MVVSCASEDRAATGNGSELSEKLDGGDKAGSDNLLPLRPSSTLTNVRISRYIHLNTLI